MTAPIPSARATRAARIARCAFTIAACARMSVAIAATDPAAPSGGAPTAAYDSPEEFGNALARAVNNRDSDVVAKFFDVHAFAQRVGRAASDDAQAQAHIATNFEQSGAMSTRILDLLQYARRESVHLVAGFKRVQRHDASVQVILRDDINGMGINYTEFELTRDGAGKLRAVDWYDFSAMGWVSSSIGIMLHLRGDVSDDPALREPLARYLSANQKGDFHGAIRALADFPPSVGDSAVILNLRTQMALAGKEPDEARQAITLIAAKYSQEPAAAQLLQGYYRDTQQYDKALKCIDVVEQSVGADATTNLWRAAIHHYRGDDRQAVKAMEKATRLEPDFSLAYRGLATEYVILKDSPRATATLATLRTRFGIDLTLKQLEEEGKDSAATALLRNRWTATK